MRLPTVGRYTVEAFGIPLPLFPEVGSRLWASTIALMRRICDTTQTEVHDEATDKATDGSPDRR